MLVLTRKQSQLIQIGDNIVIKVIRTGPGSVKLGIDAPSHVRVMRGELDERLATQYDNPTGGEQPAGESQSTPRTVRVAVGATENPSAECRRAEHVEDEESVGQLSRRKFRGCVA